jgi:hypothetical protein
MTHSIPAQSEFGADEPTRHDRLMELVAAEDASNGEVGCGRAWESKLSGYWNTSSLNATGEPLKGLLQKHLGTILMEPDFDSIITQLQRQLEVLAAPSQGDHFAPPLSAPPPETEYIPTAELRELFHPLREQYSEHALEQLIQWTHCILHKAVSRPRHTWSQPIWVLKSKTRIYIAQAANITAAIKQIKTQHPQERGALDVVTVGGILAPNQVIALDKFL